MGIPFEELVRLAQDHSQVWPSDLVEDLKEDDPHVCLQSQMYADLISQKKREYKESNFSLPTLVVPGWDKIEKKGQKNWADFENLLLFYALGKIQFSPSYETTFQRKKDTEDLRQVIEKFPILKGKKPESAEERIGKNTTYLAFGKSVLDSLIRDDQGAQHDLYREIQDAEETNSFNASKLKRSQTIARRVFSTLKKRYKND